MCEKPPALIVAETQEVKKRQPMSCEEGEGWAKEKEKRGKKMHLISAVARNTVEVPESLDCLGSLDVCERRDNQQERKGEENEDHARWLRELYTPAGSPRTVLASAPSPSTTTIRFSTRWGRKEDRKERKTHLPAPQPPTDAYSTRSTAQ
jgi:hypothetical protein